MTKNMGNIDRVLRIIIGLVLLWYAFLAPATGYNWIGFLGFIPLANWMIGHVGTVCVPNGPCLVPVAPGLMAPLLSLQSVALAT